MREDKPMLTAMDDDLEGIVEAAREAVELILDEYSLRDGRSLCECARDVGAVQREKRLAARRLRFC